MRIACQLVLLLSVAGVCLAQTVVDRMVAVVNKKIILESELDQEERVQFLLHGKALSSMEQQDTLATLDQLIDRSLLEQQIVQSGMLDPSPEEMAARVQELRAPISGAATEEGWKALLISYGLPEQDSENRGCSDSRPLFFADWLFGGLFGVEKAKMPPYSEQRRPPKKKRGGARKPPLAEVSGKIERIL